MAMHKFIVGAALLVVAFQAEAQVNRCMIDGVTTWQSAPCPPGTSTESITTQPPESAPTQRAADNRAWYEGGTLHRASVNEWRRAEYRNKLATASDWIVATKNADNLEDAKYRAGELIICVDTTVAGLDIASMNAAEIAAACLTLMYP
jgi:hypothetical protein